MPVTSDIQPWLAGEEGLPLPSRIRFELLTRTPAEIASDDTLLQQLYSGVSILTTLVAPATVSSIHITSAFLRDRTSSSAPAEANSVARRLRAWAAAMVLGALLVFIVTISLLVHVDKGRREIQQLEHAREEYQLRMLLGTMLGGLLGVTWTNGQPIQLEGVTLSLAALAFFVGYSVEVVFQVLDRIIARTTSGLRP